jgi:hypothetical protein
MEIIDDRTNHKTLSAEQVEYKGLRLKPDWQIFLDLPIELREDEFFPPDVKLVFERGEEDQEVDFVTTLRLNDLRPLNTAMSLGYLMSSPEPIKDKLEQALVHAIAPRVKVVIEYIPDDDPDNPGNINFNLMADRFAEDTQYPFEDYRDVFELTGE